MIYIGRFHKKNTSAFTAFGIMLKFESNKKDT